ncbi:hypothetical protein ACHWQZ_G018099 [Mnemiopsis leidyi]
MTYPDLENTAGSNTAPSKISYFTETFSLASGYDTLVTMTTPAAPADFLWASSENEVKCLTQDDAREEKLFECRVFNHTDLLNMAFICNRDDIHAASFVLLYLLVSLTAMVSNASVVLASIVERWKEIDQFTFVFAVSLSFNHFLVAFLVYPMGVYTMLRTDGWGLGNYWCTFTAYCTSYFEILYMMHVLMIVFDMLIYRFTKLKEVVKVYLVKKVAMSLWVTALIPHIILIWNKDWFLTDGGTLGISSKYLQCGKDGNDDKPIIDCFTAYTFTTYKELYIYLLCFFILPVAYAAISYTSLLYLRKRSMLKGTHKEELSEEDKVENARTFIQRYKASLCMVLVFSVTQLPKWITSFVLLGLDTAHNNAVRDDEKTPEDNMQGTSMVIKMDFLSFWTCLGSILIPFCYMMTCPTYFHAVTATRPLLWLRKHGEVIHGRTYSQRLRGPERQGKSPTPPSNTLQVPGQHRVRLDTASKIYMNCIAEECNGNSELETTHLNPANSPDVIVNSEAEARARSPGDVLVMLSAMDRAAESDSEDEGRDTRSSRPDIEPCGTPTSPRIVRVAPHEHSTPKSESRDLPVLVREGEETLNSTFPVRPAKPERNSNLSDVSIEEKEAAKRKLPVPRSSGMVSPAISQTFSSSSRI